MKLVIQIPCLNEESTLGEVLDSIPRKIVGFDSVEVVVIDENFGVRVTEIVSPMERVSNMT